MKETEFDVLCENASPEEAKCLRKIHAEWCRGDENSFPVQLALLTRAQWRAAARVPQMLKDSRKEWEQTQTAQRAQFFEQFSSALEDARRLAIDSKKLLDAVQADHRRQLSLQCEESIVAMARNLKDWNHKLIGYNESIQGVAGTISSDVRELEALAGKIQNQLNAGAKLWTQAKSDFDAAREKMNEERKLLEQRITTRDWIAYLLLAATLFSLGFLTSTFIRR